MSKILYPVGTSVVIKANLGPERYNRDIGRHAKVIGYSKRNQRPYTDEFGTVFPYLIEFKDTGDVSNANVQELRKLRKKKASEKDTVIEKPTVNTYTREEVDVLLAQQWKDMLELVASVDTIAVQGLNAARGVERKLDTVAGVVDRNFMAVERKFKSLNHDDD